MSDLVPDNSALVTDRADPEDDGDWADRCGYWRETPTEKRRWGPRVTRHSHKPLVLTGHGMRLSVDNGALVVRNGFTHYPQQQEQWRFFPGDRNSPSRIIVVDGSGGLSFDVLTWLSSQNIPLIKIDWRGEAVSVLGGAAGTDPRKVQLQLAAQKGSRALEIAKSIVHEKILNSIETLETALPRSPARENAIAKLRGEAAQFGKHPPNSIATLLGLEGRVARTYFRSWQSLSLKWKGVGRRPIPDDWRCVGQRQSLNTRKKGRNRFASHPVNAILNYAYAVLESHVQMQIVAEGYDPTIGYLHSYSEDRPALVFDLMEPLRPLMDRRVLEFVQSYAFHPADFTIRSDGVCRLNPEMAKKIVELAFTCAWQRWKNDRYAKYSVEKVVVENVE
jgi:CRISP-associated protein Cas1